MASKKRPGRSAMAVLRRKAEAGMKAPPPAPPAPLAPKAAGELIHELQVHQVELEMQTQELRRAQAEVLASRALYFDLYELAPIGYFTLDQKGFISSANLTGATLLGEARGALNGRHFSRYVDAQDQDLHHRQGRQVLETGQAQAWELKMKRRDGGTLWGRLDATRARSAEGPWTLRVAITDVTARKEAEASRGSSERKFEATFHASRDALALSEFESGRVVEVNQAFAQLTGFPREEVLGRPATDFFFMAPLDRAHFRTQLQASRHIEGVDFDVRTRTGVALTALCAFDLLELGGNLHVLSTLRDVAEQRRAEVALQRLASAVEQTPAGVLITDAAGNIEYVNAAFSRATGYGREEVLGKNPRLLKSGLTPEDVYRELWAAISAGHTWQGGLVNRTKDGRHITENTSIAPILDPRGVISSFVSVRRDVTRELELQAQLVEAQKLESVGRLAGGIAHDFNNVLAVVLLAVDELRLAQLPPPEQVRALAGEIHDAASRARDLTRQLLAFARKQVFAPTLIDLGDVLSRTEQLLRRMLGEDIALLTRAAVGPWLIRCDPGQLEQVLLNLAINARDSMPAGGRLTLTASRLPEGDPAGRAYPDLPPGDLVELAVADSGAGMAPEVLARVFEPFFTTKGVGKGTGLGLATVHGIIKQSGGAIRCESRPGQGTTFFLCFPRAAPQVEPPVLPASTPSRVARRAGTETLLLVEDDLQVRRAALRALEAAGYRVLVAEDGRSALALAAREPGAIDLLVTDVIMPGMDGGSLAVALRAAHPGLPTLFLSGYADDALSDHGVLKEGIELLSKPFTAVELLGRVRGLLDARPS